MLFRIDLEQVLRFNYRYSGENILKSVQTSEILQQSCRDQCLEQLCIDTDGGTTKNECFTSVGKIRNFESCAFLFDLFDHILYHT